MTAFSNTIVIGATGGIGSAMAEVLEDRGAAVTRLARSTDPAIDVTDEAAIEAAAEAVRDGGPYDLIFVATGALAPDDRGPEKALSQLHPQRLSDLIALNAIGPALVAKHFHGLLPRDDRGVLAALSARVGSIGDNGLGGWYGYRASKAALNQFWRGAAIEIGRKRKQTVVLALHPGTVETRLSAGFTDGRDTFTPEQCTLKLLDVMEAATPEMSGGFFDHAGKTIPW
ncbi:MAG: SDR family NAD(P)-dependent oxidoreductase [Minwuia sp.]|uniref:SDR family NAD(P)-dependent oxidoreductase n=1 Tax=Minwuia sp. TaxID=2493630 RepID=UPI003A86F7AE